MTKYVIDLPAETKVIVAKKQFLLNETDLMRIPVSQLELYVEPTVAENATVEKPVIELPVELFNYLVKIKKTHRGGISHFMSDVIKNRLIIHDLDTEDVLKDEMLVDWYSHPELVEFVPKDEPKYMVEVDMHDKYGNLKRAHVWQNDKHGAFTPYIDDAELPSTYYNYKEFSEEVADKLVAGLTALKPRKVKVEE